ncbi:hypothetical protein K491DRAFT_783180 [Lophiostoma macrostomum CBS 122681]|uniref:Uncharacterized protein n=1 Tax=Lophiostoma macrostomum CBS 122681 TaxID=1314788 RepID=A0A6A6SQ81_9PLEO|nr:hypothetical protein K491DRAFT_783180 [Lophiostoma macrostomum CBS 122681]
MSMELSSLLYGAGLGCSKALECSGMEHSEAHAGVCPETLITSDILSEYDSPKVGERPEKSKNEQFQVSQQCDGPPDSPTTDLTFEKLRALTRDSSPDHDVMVLPEDDLLSMIPESDPLSRASPPVRSEYARDRWLNEDAHEAPWFRTVLPDDQKRSRSTDVSSAEPRSAATQPSTLNLQPDSRPIDMHSRWVNALRSQRSNSMPRESPHTPTIDRVAKKSRKGLPLIFELVQGQKTVMTGYDTGTQANHISLELAEEMGYEIASSEEDKAEFELANGKIIESIGRISAVIKFAQDERAGDKTTVTCYFNVFRKLALPALIGMAFLSATETLSTYTSRLVELPQDWKRSLRLCAVGSTSNHVSCVLDGKRVFAHADTGAEIALVSGEYAMRHGLLKGYSCEEIMLADGSIVYTSGHSDVEFFVPPFGTESWKLAERKLVRFHVLKNLQFDVILDEELVENFRVFQQGAHALISGGTRAMSSIATIIRMGSVEKAIHTMTERVKDWKRGKSPAEAKAESSGSAGDANECSESTSEEILRLWRLLDSMDQEELRVRIPGPFTANEERAEQTRIEEFQRKREEIVMEHQRLTREQNSR